MPFGDYDRVVVTGAGGWVGRNAVDLLINQMGGALFVDRAVLATAHPRAISTPVGDVVTVATADLLDLGPVPRTLLIHCGFPTQDQVEAMGEQSYVDAITQLRVAMVNIIKRAGRVDMVYVSSGAATDVQRGAEVAHRTHVYGQAKLDDESAYADAIGAQGGRLSIVRAFALSGPYMTKPETYALGSLILQAQRAGAIEVMADHPVRRSYMAMNDMLRIAIASVDTLSAGGALRFETAGEVVEVGDLARRVLAVLGYDPDTVTRPALDRDAPANDYLGDPAALTVLAGLAGVVPVDLDAQITATAAWLASGTAA